MLEYRSGTEKDLDEVLQIPQIFANVGKGAVASSADLQKAFPGKSNDEIILEILRKGELQVGEKEREAQLEKLHNEVLAIVAGKCVDPRTKRVYTASMIEKALSELREKGEKLLQHKDSTETPTTSVTTGASDTVPIWHGVASSRPAKALALEAIKALVYHQPIPIARARMRIKVHIPNTVPGVSSAQIKKCKVSVQEQFGSVEEVGGSGSGWECIGFVEPGKYRTIAELVGAEMKGKGVVEVLDMAVSIPAISISVTVFSWHFEESICLQLGCFSPSRMFMRVKKLDKLPLNKNI